MGIRPRLALAVALPLLLLGPGVSATTLDEEKEAALVTVAPTEVPPVIDGRLDDACWRWAAQVSLRTVWADAQAPVRDTAALITFDRASIYVAFDCAEQDMGSVTPPGPTETGVQLWEADWVTALLDPEHDHRAYGIWVDAGNGVSHSIEAGRPPDHWVCEGLVTATSRAGDRWSVEMLIPLASLGGARRPRPGDVWCANFARRIATVTPNQFSFWQPVWGGCTYPEEPGRAHLLFAEEAPVVELLDLGDDWGDLGGDGRLRALLRSRQPARVIASATMVQGGQQKSLGSRQVEIQPGRETELSFTYRVEDPGARLRLEVRNEAATLFRTWALPVQGRFLRPRLTVLASRLKELGKQVGRLPETRARASLDRKRADLAHRLQALEQGVSTSARRDRETWEGFDLKIRQARVELDRMQVLAAAHALARGIPAGKASARAVVSCPDYLELVHSFTPPRPEWLPASIALFAAAGEYEPATVLVTALQDCPRVLAVAGDLSGPGGLIPAAEVDLRLVKCWYQAGKGGVTIEKEDVFTPELLLYDDSIIKTDPVWERNLPGFQDLPVDHPPLKPVDIPAGQSQQWWVTVHVPANTHPGIYRGRILVHGEGWQSAVPIEVEVLDLELPPPRQEMAIFSSSVLLSDTPEGMGSLGRYRAELLNLARHGITNPTIYDAPGEKMETFRRILSLRAELGLSNAKPVFMSHPIRSPAQIADPAVRSALVQEVREYVSRLKEMGAGEVCFYGKDEATGDDLREQIPLYRAYQEGGARVVVAIWYGANKEIAGNSIDIPLISGPGSREEVDYAHRLGLETWNYGYPQGGVEDPRVYRQNYGFGLYRRGLDGVCNFAYWVAFGTAWVDRDGSGIYRDHNMVYPTRDGVIDTIQWEGNREAVDDLRYIAALEQAIEAARQGGVSADAIERAEAVLEQLDPEGDLQAQRRRLADAAIALRALLR